MAGFTCNYGRLYQRRLDQDVRSSHMSHLQDLMIYKDTCVPALAVVSVPLLLLLLLFQLMLLLLDRCQQVNCCLHFSRLAERWEVLQSSLL